MSAPFWRPAGHDRARELAAVSIDEPLTPDDAAWLDAHLAGCAACATVADAYDADRLLFAPLRDTAPVPPRDLWARTAAAIDAEAGSGRAGSAPGRRLLGLPVVSLAPLAGLAVVAVIVGSTLLNGGPAIPAPVGPSGPAPTAIALAPGQVAVLTRGKDGGLEVRTAGVGEVCPLDADRCQAAAPSFATSPITGIDASGDVAAIISPQRDRIVVVQRSATGSDGVFVVPVRPAVAATPALPSPVPTDGPSAAATEPATASTEPSPSSPSGSPSVEPSPSANGSPSSVPPTSEPTDGPPPTDEPGGSASPAPVGTPAATSTDEPAPSPTIEVTPLPDGTIEIARNVVVVGGVAAYDADGNHFAFTARPADGSAGPDVYVWKTSDTRARAVTTDHRSMFAGWDGFDLLVSRVVDGAPRTIAVSARTGAEKSERGQAAWLPTVSPDGTTAVWWDGSVRLAADGVTWVPEEGRLVIGAWPDGVAQAQPITRDDVTDWEVRWTPDGSAVAVWIAGGARDRAGRLNLYAVDPDTGRAHLGQPLLQDEPAFGGFSLEARRLAYTAPVKGGRRTVWVVAWDGDSVGRVELPGEAGATVVR